MTTPNSPVPLFQQTSDLPNPSRVSVAIGRMEDGPLIFMPLTGPARSGKSACLRPVQNPLLPLQELPIKRKPARRRRRSSARHQKHSLP